MKTTVKTLIAGAAVAAGALFSTGASAESLLQLHEQHKAELLNFLHHVTASISIGPTYAAAPVYAAPPPVYVAPAPAYVDPYGGQHGWRGARDYDRRDDRGYAPRDGRGFAPQQSRGYAPSPNQQYAQYENGQFKGYISERDYARPNGR